MVSEINQIHKIFSTHDAYKIHSLVHLYFYKHNKNSKTDIVNKLKALFELILNSKKENPLFYNNSQFENNNNMYMIKYCPVVDSKLLFYPFLWGE